MERVFGEILGIEEGQKFRNRIELSLAKVHRPRQAGISGSQNEGADSIVLSGGYEDDKDFGEVVIYTGYGGRDPNTGKQVSDQELIKQNLALTVNCQEGLPVRLIRGASHKSKFSPKEGYRYDGLYRVEQYWKKIGQSGFNVWLFRLRKIPRNIDKNLRGESQINEESDEYKSPDRKEITNKRIVRDSKLSKRIKELYGYKCQVCRVAIQINTGLYAQAAHIKPLGVPHNGPDSADNILCLCPNHHVQFDFGGFSIADNFELIGIERVLFVHPNHKINLEFIKYHREHFFEEY